MEKYKYIFEVVKDTPAGALVWHCAPFTGSVELIIPSGTRAYLGPKMNPAKHYIRLVNGSYSERWLDSVVEKAKKESPAPDRFNGLTMFLFIKTLVSDNIKFLPPEQQDEKTAVQEDILKTLNKEYLQAKRLAEFEEYDETFLSHLKEGSCRRQIDDEDRKALLM